MNDKKNSKPKAKKSADDGALSALSSKAELKEFLLDIRDKMADGTSSPIYALSAMNHILNHSEIYSFLDKANKELCRDIWLRINQAGFQVRTPPMLFSEEEEAAMRSA